MKIFSLILMAIIGLATSLVQAADQGSRHHA